MILSEWLVSGFLLLIIAYLIHQKMIDWAFHYSQDASSLDELSYREVLVQDIIASLFVYALIMCLFMAAIWFNTYLYGQWLDICIYIQQHFKGAK